MAEFWGDGSGSALALTAAYVEGSTLEIKRENELWLIATLSGTDVVACDLKLEVSFDAGTSFTEVELPIVAIDGEEESAFFPVLVPPQCQVKLSAKRRGGAVDSALLVTAWPRMPTGVIEAGRSRIINKAVAIDDTANTPAGSAGDPIALDTSLEYGDWFSTGEGDLLEILVAKTGANNPTEVFFEVQRQEGSNGHPLDAIDSVISGDATHSAMEIRATDIDATDGLYRLYRCEVSPRTQVRVGARYNGGTSPSILAHARITKR